MELSDPRGVIGFPIVNDGSAERILTGADVDPESFQHAARTARTGWATSSARGSCTSTPGQLLDAPYPLPDGLWSPNHPRLAELGPNTIANSRGIEAMALTPDGRYLYVVLEGAVIGDAAGSRRVYEFDTRRQRFTGRLPDYRVEPGATGDTNLVADAQAPDRRHLLLIERDGRGGARLPLGVRGRPARRRGRRLPRQAAGARPDGDPRSRPRVAAAGAADRRRARRPVPGDVRVDRGAADRVRTPTPARL